jgi:hypothetical protein
MLFCAVTRSMTRMSECTSPVLMSLASIACCCFERSASPPAPSAPSSAAWPVR